MFGQGSPTLLGFPIWDIKGTEIGHSFPYFFYGHWSKIYVRVVTRYIFSSVIQLFLPKILISDSKRAAKFDPWCQLKFTDPDPMTCNPRSWGCDSRYQGGDPWSHIPGYDPDTFDNRCKSYILQVSFCQMSWCITLWFPDKLANISILWKCWVQYN